MSQFSPSSWYCSWGYHYDCVTVCHPQAVLHCEPVHFSSKIFILVTDMYIHDSNEDLKKYFASWLNVVVLVLPCHFSVQSHIYNIQQSAGLFSHLSSHVIHPIYMYGVNMCVCVCVPFPRDMEQFFTNSFILYDIFTHFPQTSSFCVMPMLFQFPINTLILCDFYTYPISHIYFHFLWSPCLFP